MSVEIICGENHVTAVLKGELDHHSALLIRTELDSRLQTLTPSLLILDFSGVEFMDSSGIGLILGRQRIQSSYGGTVAIKNVSPYVRKIITISGLSSLIIDR